MKIRRTLFAVAGMACLVLGVSSGARAGTITFDEFGSGTTIDSNTYAGVGVHFAPNWGDNTGVIMAGGTWGITGINGPQFSAWTPVASSSGFTVHFDDPQSQFSICIALGTDPGVGADFTWMAFNDNGQVGMGTSSFPGTPGTWTTFTITSAMVGGNPFNEVALMYACSGNQPQVGYDFPAVPVPASLLLLGSGLIPLLPRRKR